MTRTCSIQGCGKHSHCRGWCEPHYSRWRKHGDPLGGKTARDEAQRFYREIVLTDDRGPDDECLIWPYSRFPNGYGQLALTRHHNYGVHRLVCKEVYGEPPTPDHEAAHSCNRGKFGCVTKSHLSWKTRLENKADELLHGTRCQGAQHGMAKITESEAREIIALKGTLTQQKIGELFGISHASVGRLHRRQNWACL